MKTWYLYFMLLFCATSSLFADDRKEVDRTTVNCVDYGKWLGKWYEIARFDNPRERDLVAVTATYSLAPDGVLRIYHEGFVGSRDGKCRSVEGKAKVADVATGHVRVSYMWVFSMDYYILELDTETYGYALIVGSEPDELWIMSRTPRMPLPILNRLLRRMTERGFDVRQLIYVDQR